MVEVRGYVKRPSREPQLRRGSGQLTCIVCENCSIRYTSLDPVDMTDGQKKAISLATQASTCSAQRGWRPRCGERAHVHEPAGAAGPYAQLHERAARLHCRHGVQELRIMSAQADHRTLAGILELAYHEALRRRRAGE